MVASAVLWLGTGGAAVGAVKPFYSHYWITGIVSVDAVPAANRQVNLYYRDPNQAISATTDAQGRYLLNAYDLQYFHNIPLIFGTENYAVAVSQQPGETGVTSQSILLKTARGYLDQFFNLFTGRQRPRVISALPTGGNALDVPTTPPSPMIIVTFSETMDVTSIPGAMSLPTLHKLMGWMMSYDNSHSVFYFEPGSYLAPMANNIYSVSVLDAASDEVGNRLEGPYKWTFSPSPIPYVVQSAPDKGETNVPRLPAVQFKFSEAMNWETVIAAVSLPGKGAPWTYKLGNKENATDCTITFYPHNALDGGTHYTIGVSRAAVNPAGNAIYSAYSATFKTTDQFVGPKVIGIISGTSVPPTAAMWAMFSEPIDPNTLPANMELKNNLGNNISGRFSWDGTTYTAKFIPDSPLQALGQYTFTVKAGITDQAGYHLLKPVSSRLIIADLTGPEIKHVWFDGRAFVDGDIISPTAQITAEISDPSGLDYSAMTMSVGNVLLVNRSSFRALDAYSGNRLTYKIYPSLPEGSYVMTIEAYDTRGNSSDWQGHVKVYSGETRIVPGTIPFASPASFSPLKSAAAGMPIKVTMVYQLTTPGNIDLQLQGISGMVWARRFAANSMGGYAGYNAVDWDGKDNGGGAVANGVYTFRIINNGRLLGKGFIIVFQ